MRVFITVRLSSADGVGLMGERQRRRLLFAAKLSSVGGIPSRALPPGIHRLRSAVMVTWSGRARAWQRVAGAILMPSSHGTRWGRSLEAQRFHGVALETAILLLLLLLPVLLLLLLPPPSSTPKKNSKYTIIEKSVILILRTLKNHSKYALTEKSVILILHTPKNRGL